MAAVAASLLCHLKAGDHVVSARALFGSCRYIVEDLLPRYGITTALIDGRDLGAWEAAVKPNTRAFFFETPTNPVLELVDIAAVAAIAKKAGAVTVSHLRFGPRPPWLVEVQDGPQMGRPAPPRGLLAG